MTIERESFVQAMRSVANSVAVVTTDGAAGRHGATVTAFCSVSADPPSVLVCLRIESRIALAVTRNGTDRFAGRSDAPLIDRFDGVDVVGLRHSPARSRPHLRSVDAYHSS